MFAARRRRVANLENDVFMIREVGALTDLVALRAGSPESLENIFPSVFPRFPLISDHVRCQKRILRIILNFPMYSKFSQRLEISHKKSSLKTQSPKPRICLISLYILVHCIDFPLHCLYISL